jgi:3-oxoacyl-[acyl-carrier-protein] synthase-1
MGIINACGRNVQETFLNLSAERSGIGQITILDTIHRSEIPGAEVKLSDIALLDQLELKTAVIPSRTALLGMVAAREAWKSSNPVPDGTWRTGLVSATSVGGMDKTEGFYPLFMENPGKGRLRDVMGHDCADSTIRISNDLGISDFITTISTACSSSVNSLIMGCNLIRNGILDRCLAGGTDAMTRFTLNGFKALMILDKQGCRPFDQHRAGLTLGEGAAFLMLESEEMLERYPRAVWGRISGFGNANDAYHQTASSPEGRGAFLAMSKALIMSSLSPESIHYINAHGTGTQNNDLTEGIAIQRLFGNRIPPFSSTKGYTGHTLAAAGAVESVISLLSLHHRKILSNIGWKTPMEEINIRPVTSSFEPDEMYHIMSNSFGFGGNSSSIIFSRC